MASFIPYAYFQNKTNLKLWVKEISKTLYDARNMAINWFSNTWTNKSIWVYLNSSDTYKNKITYLSYPYDFTWSQIDFIESVDIKKIKEINLPKNIQIKDISWKDNALIFFSSIYWDGKYYYWDSSWNRQSLSWEILINVNYANSASPLLNMELKYITWTYIVDY